MQVVDTRGHQRVRVAVVGKGGSGKSVLSGTLARVLARSGHRVLALDSDVMPGLAFTLGVKTPPEPALLAAAFRGEDNRWRFTPGTGPVRAVQRYAYDAPDGIRLLEFGKSGPDGQAPIMPAIQAYWRIIHGIGEARTFRDWSFVGDLPAGPRQVAYDWAPYAETFLLVAEPTMQSLLTARRVARVASSRAGRTTVISLVASKVKNDADLQRIEDFLGLRAATVIPRDAEVAEAERLGVAPIDHAPGCPAVRAVEDLARTLGERRPARAAGPRTPRTG